MIESKKDMLKKSNIEIFSKEHNETMRTDLILIILATFRLREILDYLKSIGIIAFKTKFLHNSVFVGQGMSS